MGGTDIFKMYTGVATLKPVEYRVAPMAPIMPPWWAFWRKPKQQWAVCSDILSLGPFGSVQAAEAAADMCRKYSNGGEP